MSPRQWWSFVIALAVSGAVVAPAHATDLSGRWSGAWHSCSTGHAGVLRATFTPCGPNQYRVVFTGRFLKIVPFRYAVTLDVVADDGEQVTLAGSSYLGRLFGTFHYTATADGCSFTARYSSRKDDGTFTLRRVGS